MILKTCHVNRYEPWCLCPPRTISTLTPCPLISACWHASSCSQGSPWSSISMHSTALRGPLGDLMRPDLSSYGKRVLSLTCFGSFKRTCFGFGMGAVWDMGALRAHLLGLQNGPVPAGSPARCMAMRSSPHGKRSLGFGHGQVRNKQQHQTPVDWRCHQAAG